MTFPLRELLSKIPDSTASKVEQVRRRYSPVIRDLLRRETGFMLNRPKTSEIRSLDPKAVEVPVKLVAGFPKSIEKLKFTEKDELMLLLSPYYGRLESIQAGIASIEGLIDKLRKLEVGKQLLDGRDSSLIASQALTKVLLEHLALSDPVRFVLSVNEDILGVYRYYVPVVGKQRGRYDEYAELRECSIELYWGVIGLLAIMLDVTTESLATVVLIHELSHAYTHVGADIDGERWSSIAFSDSDHALKEGLAQYYTDLVALRLKEKDPEVHLAYERLVERQPEAYRVHLAWIRRYRPEEIRHSMLAIRRADKGTIEQFENELLGAKSRLRFEKKSNQ